MNFTITIQFTVECGIAIIADIGVASSTFLLLTITIIVDGMIAIIAFESVIIVGGFVGDAATPRAYGAASAGHAASSGYAFTFLIDFMLAAIAPSVSISNITFEIIICHHTAFSTVWRRR